MVFRRSGREIRISFQKESSHILVTRPSPAGEELVSRLRTLGQVAWHFPLIEFSPGRQLPQLADQLAALGESDLLFALSQHAVNPNGYC